MEERARDLNQGAPEAPVSGGAEQGYFYLVWVPQSVERRFLAN